MEIEFDDRLREKSATGGGGGVLEDEPPQLAHTDASEGELLPGPRDVTVPRVDTVNFPRERLGLQDE